jgi:hypothetical protein
MNNNICQSCGQNVQNCICPAVAQFFSDNGHLMATESGTRREQEEKKKFFYVKGPNLLINQ